MDVVEVCVVRDVREIPLTKSSRVFCNRAQGMIGIKTAFHGNVVRFAPTQMVAGNFSFDKALNPSSQGFRALRKFRTTERIRSFSAKQYLLPDEEFSRPIELYRGSTLIATTPSDSSSRAMNLAKGIGRWMVNNLSADGGLPYKYWPSRGEVSPADNAICRFLATLSLARLGELTGSKALRHAAVRNLR